MKEKKIKIVKLESKSLLKAKLVNFVDISKQNLPHMLIQTQNPTHSCVFEF